MVGTLPPRVEVDGLTLVVPSHNESITLESVLRHWWAERPKEVSFRILVVDDASDDDTPRVLRELETEMAITSIRSTTRLGFGGALRAGINRTTTKWVAFTDADGQYDPRDLPRLLTALSAGNDLVVGLRSPRADSFLRKSVSFGFRSLVFIFFGFRSKDPTTSLRAGRADQIRAVADRARYMNGSFWNEFMIRWDRAGFSFVEMPVRHYRRRDGQSKVASGAQIARASVQHLIALLRIWRELHRFEMPNSPAPHSSGQSHETDR